jgi:uroporphyrin-III C-methyltransferase/precorrin-2 dehydrogenase/sirohydrochlorin ferrochelatase
MDQLPIFMNLTGEHCLVVGGNAVAARKAELLTKANATVTLVSPRIEGEARRMVADGYLQWRQSAFQRRYLDGVRLVIATTDDAAEAQRVYTACTRRGIPVNVADVPSMCTFILPGIVDRSPMTIAVSTGARSPVLARLVRRRLESLIPPSYGRLTALLARFRDKAKQCIDGVDNRQRFWESVIEGPIGNMAMAGRDQEAAAALDERLDARDTEPETGEVYLIGAGPGAVDLLTNQAQRLLSAADVIVYDRLVSPAIVDLGRREAERIYVGKTAGQHAMSQETISRVLIDKAHEGCRVARLKGGDPFIFGRGGEELEAIVDAGIDFQIAPGITAASGCASYAGIPLTHRDHAHSVRFITGHRHNGDLRLPWSDLAQCSDTLVFYMGLASLPELCAGLIEHGRPASTPAVVVEQGTTANQRLIRATLADLDQHVAAIRPPALLIVGEVARLSGRFEWFRGGEGRSAFLPGYCNDGRGPYDPTQATIGQHDGDNPVTTV